MLAGRNSTQICPSWLDSTFSFGWQHSNQWATLPCKAFPYAGGVASQLGKNVDGTSAQRYHCSSRNSGVLCSIRGVLPYWHAWSTSACGLCYPVTITHPRSITRSFHTFNPGAPASVRFGSTLQKAWSHRHYRAVPTANLPCGWVYGPFPQRAGCCHRPKRAFPPQPSDGKTVATFEIV